MGNLLEKFRRILVANELSGDLSLAYRFSDPDGVRTGKSGWSFGVCQFDLANNGAAAQCLRDCGFDPATILALISQKIPVRDVFELGQRLFDHAWIVDAWDKTEMERTLAHVRTTFEEAGLAIDERTSLHLCDYHNQFGLAPRGKCVRYMLALGRPITAEDVLRYKDTTLWGQKRPDDVKRRWRNVEKECAA
jgi:hypothetical protein